MNLPRKDETGTSEVRWVEQNLYALMKVDAEACEELIDKALKRELWTICRDTYELDSRVRLKTGRKLITDKKMPVSMKSQILRRTEAVILSKMNVAIWNIGLSEDDIRYWLDSKRPEALFTEIARSPEMLKWYELYREKLLARGITYICRAVHLSQDEKLELAKRHLAGRVSRNEKFTKREFRAARQTFSWEQLKQLLAIDRSCLLPSTSYRLWNIVSFLSMEDVIDELPVGQVKNLDDDEIDYQTSLAFHETDRIRTLDQKQFENSAPNYASEVRHASENLPRTMFEILRHAKCRKPKALRELMSEAEKLTKKRYLTHPERIFIRDTLYLLAKSPNIERAALSKFRKRGVHIGLVKMYRAFLKAGTPTDELTLEGAKIFVGPNCAACIAAAEAGVIQTTDQLRQMNVSVAVPTPALL